MLPTVHAQSQQPTLRTMSIASALDTSPADIDVKPGEGESGNEDKRAIGSQARKTGGVPVILTSEHNVIYQCDSCLKSPLQGYRYRCDQCAEYDLCQECKDQGKHDSTHTFKRFTIDPESTARYLQMQQQVGGAVGIPVRPFPQQLAPLSAVASAAGVESMGTGSRPPRRSASTKSNGSLTEPLERMDDVLARAHVGPLPASHTSSVIASQFLELFDAGQTAMDRHKKARVLEQINARIAMTLVGIPQRARRGANFIPRTLPEPIEQDIVVAAMAGLCAQLMALDTEKTLHRLENEEDGQEAMDLEKIRSNVENGVYFRRIEKPVQAISLFSKHILRVYAHGPKFGAPEAICQRFDKLARQAIDELKEALGMEVQPSQSSADLKDDDSSSVSGEIVNGAKKRSSGGPSSSSAAAGKDDKSSTTSTPTIPSASLAQSVPVLAPPAQLDNLPKKKRKREDGEGQQVQGQYPVPVGSDMVLMHPHSLSGGPPPPQQMILQPHMQPMMAPVITSMMPPHVQQQGGGMKGTRQSGPNSEVDDLKQEVKRLKEEVEDAHERIDVLISLLREKIANPLTRGLDRAGR